MRRTVGLWILVVGVAASTLAAQHAGTMPHADHNPHHGGSVMMRGDLHFEVVVEPGGVYSLYLSDAMRKPLAPDFVADPRFTVTPTGGAAETLILEADDTCECSRAKGRDLTGAAMIRVAFDQDGEPYWIDLPWDPSTSP